MARGLHSGRPVKLFRQDFVDTGLGLMSSKLKVAGWVALGAVAGALTTMQLQANARSSLSP